MSSQPSSLAERERLAKKRRLDAYDWDFATEQSESLFSKLHWHPCRFPSQVPAAAISRLSERSDVVLDPFMGSATTLVEAQRLGRHSIGIDVNPISALIAKSKLCGEKTASILSYIDGLHNKVQAHWESLVPADVPSSVQQDKWFAPSTLTELQKLWSIVSLDRSKCAEIGMAVFSSVLISSCKETRHWGYICDNSTPKTEKVGLAREAFIKGLKLYRASYLNREASLRGSVPTVKVLQGDARTKLTEVDDGAVDLIVTSPPYFGVADYVKAQRLSMEWLNLEIEPVRKSEIGARSKRHRKTAANDFLQELGQVFKESYRVLKQNSYAVIVFGSSPVRQNMLPDFLLSLENAGFDIESNISRNISSMRRQFPSLATERVIVLRK